MFDQEYMAQSIGTNATAFSGHGYNTYSTHLLSVHAVNRVSWHPRASLANTFLTYLVYIDICDNLYGIGNLSALDHDIKVRKPQSLTGLSYRHALHVMWECLGHTYTYRAY